MSVFFFSEKLGNAIVVGCGKCEIAKFWFDGGEKASTSPFTQETPREKAEELVEFLDKTVPKNTLTEEAYGDSDVSREKIRLLDKMSDMAGKMKGCGCDDCDDDEDDDEGISSFDIFMKMMAMMED